MPGGRCREIRDLSGEPDCPEMLLKKIARDPGELTNLWDDAEYQDTKKAMMERLVHEQIALNDNSPQPLGRA